MALLRTLGSVGVRSNYLARRLGTRPLPPPAGMLENLPDNTPKPVQAFAVMAAGESIVPFTYDLPSTEPPPGYVDVDVTHCGICHSDIHQIDNAWGVASFPLVPGHEIVGTVTAIGADAVTRAKFRVGDRAASCRHARR